MTRRPFPAAGLRARFLVTSLLGATALALAGSAPASIRLGTGIGPVQLGMTSSQLVRALGRPVGVRSRGASPVARRLNRDPSYLEYEYFQKNGYTVGLAKRRGKLRVVMVVVYIRGQHTPQGIGVGSFARYVQQQYPGVRCGILDEISRACVVAGRSNGETVFVVDRLRVTAVAVRVRA